MPGKVAQGRTLLRGSCRINRSLGCLAHLNQGHAVVFLRRDVGQTQIARVGATAIHALDAAAPLDNGQLKLDMRRLDEGIPLKRENVPTGALRTRTDAGVETSAV